MKEIIIEDWEYYIDEPVGYRDYALELEGWLDEKGRLCLADGENDYRDVFHDQWAGLMNEEFYAEYMKMEQGKKESIIAKGLTFAACDLIDIGNSTLDAIRAGKTGLFLPEDVWNTDTGHEQDIILAYLEWKAEQ